jgi:hypothetical protein
MNPATAIDCVFRKICVADPASYTVNNSLNLQYPSCNWFVVREVAVSIQANAGACRHIQTHAGTWPWAPSVYVRRQLEACHTCTSIYTSWEPCMHVCSCCGSQYTVQRMHACAVWSITCAKAEVDEHIGKESWARRSCSLQVGIGCRWCSAVWGACTTADDTHRPLTGAPRKPLLCCTASPLVMLPLTCRSGTVSNVDLEVCSMRRLSSRS